LKSQPYSNQQLFSDHYLDVFLPQREEWQALTQEAEPVMQRIGGLFGRYRPSDKEAQVEREFIRPVLELLGHTFEVQASLATPDGTKSPDYVFYRDEAALQAAKGKKLTDTLLQAGAFAVGDAKYWDCPLDVAMKGRSGDPFTNKNPSYQIAFYMQHSGLEWGILTNGRLWRLYHKSNAHKLDHFYEVDLPALLAGGSVEDFLYFYAFFRRAAFNAHPLGVSAILRESIEYAQGIGASLREQVYQALRHIAQGFLDYPSNHLSADNPETLKEIYDNALIILYRLLFILYAEARNLLPVYDSDLYLENYSLRALAHTVADNLNAGRILRSNSTNLYHAFKQLCAYIDAGDPPLKISTFNGGLFDPARHAFIERNQIGDARFQQAIDMLARVNGQFIDYRDLSVRHLGTIYEGLLEYHLERAQEPQDGWTIELLTERGERKATGSYYTPDYIVKYIVDETLGPVLKAAVEQAGNEKARTEAVLAIKVLDPAMGSGHFLVEATEYIARFLVEMNAQAEKASRETDLAYWKRRVVQSCIYGVDLNPLAVELAKLSLWLSTVARDRPLSFLDHHLRTGNALLGARMADLAVAPNGSGTARKAKKQETPQEQLSLFDDEAFRQNITSAVNLMWLVEDSPAQTVAQVKEQEQLYADMRQGLTGKYGSIANLFMAHYYGISVDPKLWKPLFDFATGRLLAAPSQFQEWLDAASALAGQQRTRFFHWELEFPEVFFDKHGQPKRERAGFDAVIGNPPWIRQESFSEDKPALKQLYSVYHGVADLSTYFVELGNSFLKEGGRFGFIIPNKFVRANYGGALRNFLTGRVRLERLVDFGDLPVFAEAVTYPLIVLTTKQAPDGSPVKYTHLEQLQPDALAASIAQGETQLSPALLGESHWSLSGADKQAIVEKMRSLSTPLGEYTGVKIYRGILTGLNEAFVIDRAARDALIAADPKSAEIIKPFLVGEDVKRYHVDYKERYVIFTKRGIDICQYPAIEKHLLQYRTRLEPKPADWNDSQQGEWQGRKPGTYKWYEIQDTVAYYEAFEKPKIIFPDIAKGCEFAFDSEGFYSTNTTYIMPVDASQQYLVPLLNSSLIAFFFRTISALIRGDYLRFFTQYVTQIPIRRIAFTTPAEARNAKAQEGLALAQAGKTAELLALAQDCLGSEQEQADVVHDLLTALAQRMIDLHAQRQVAIEDFIYDLKGALSDAQMQRLNRLWTPLAGPQEGEADTAARRRSETARQKLGSLAAQQLDLRDDIGKLRDEQWEWLLRERLTGNYSLARLMRIFQQRQPALATLDSAIAASDTLIDQIVYRLYGLTEEEIAVVEGGE